LHPEVPCHADGVTAGADEGHSSAFAPAGTLRAIPYKQKIQKTVHMRMLKLMTDASVKREIEGIVPYLEGNHRVRHSNFNIFVELNV
jgi:hypothetical protein